MKTLLIIFLAFCALVGVVIWWMKGAAKDEPIQKYSAPPFEEFEEHWTKKENV